LFTISATTEGTGGGDGNLQREFRWPVLPCFFHQELRSLWVVLQEFFEPPLLAGAVFPAPEKEAVRGPFVVGLTQKGRRLRTRTRIKRFFY
jgi:hypothetical protein